MSGSQLYYCVELGLDYYLLGGRAKYYNLSRPDNPLGKIVTSDLRNIVLEKDEMFFRLRRGNRKQVNRWMDEVLGLDGINISTPAEIRKIFIRETVRLVPIIILKVSRHMLLSFVPTALKAQIKNLSKSILSR